MTMNMIRIGDYFINLHTILWAKLSFENDKPGNRRITLVCGNDASSQYLQFQGDEAEELIKAFESYSRDLTPPEFQPLR